MSRTRWLSIFAVLLGLALVSCSGGTPPGDDGGGGTEPPEAVPPGILGYVVEANAGAAVVDSTIDIYPAGTSTPVATVSSGSDGSFTVDLDPGAYNLVAHKEGYAGSQVLNVRVAEDGKTNLTIIQRKAFHPDWPTDPPQVTLEKVEDGEVYDGNFGYVPYRIVANPAAPLKTDLIYAALGKTPGAGFITGFREIFVSIDDTGDVFLDPIPYGVVGPTTFQAVVYDTNGNRTQVNRYIEITFPFEGSVDLVAPELRMAMAFTLNKGLAFFSASPQAAPEGGNLYVQLVWLPQQDFSDAPNDAPYGYHIYRSFDGENYERIGTVFGFYNSYIDASPELAPGRTTWYKVTAFVGEIESEASNVLTTTPLDAFDVFLDAPADNAMDVSTTPTITRHVSQTVSNYHYYAGVLWDTLTGESLFWVDPTQFTLVNQTEWTWNEDGAYTGSPFETLQKGHSYEWQLALAYALDDPLHPTAVSVAADGLGLWAPFGMESTDHFTFTTAP